MDRASDPALQAWRLQAEPFYQPNGDEVAHFDAAAAQCLPLLIKGPTGCGKPDLSNTWPGGCSAR